MIRAIASIDHSKRMLVWALGVPLFWIAVLIMSASYYTPAWAGTYGIAPSAPPFKAIPSLASYLESLRPSEKIHPETIIGSYKPLKTARYILDATDKLDADQILGEFIQGRSNAFERNDLHLGPFHHNVWIMLVFQNQSAEDVQLVLEHDYPSMEADLYFRTMDIGDWATTANGFINKTPETYQVKYRYPYFMIKAAQGYSIALLRIRTTFPYLTLNVWDAKSFIDHAQWDSMRTSLLVGSMLALLIYNLLSFLVSRALEKLYYCLYIIGFLSFAIWVQGLGKLYLPPSTLRLFMEVITVWSGLTMIFSHMFALEFLLDSDGPLKARRLVIISIGFYAIGIVYGLYDLTIGPIIHMATTVVSIPTVIYIANQVRLKGGRHAVFYLVSWLFVGFGIMLFSLSLLNILPGGTTAGVEAWFYGGFLEMVTLSLALGDKAAKRLRDQNVQIQAEQKLIAHAFSQMEKVFFSHQVARIKNGESLESTMPVGPGEACVICFDIIGSSKIQHVKAKDFFRNVFRRCNEIMIEGYNGQDLVGNAYRIKEMGDGFLCSVGYPFKSPHDSIVIAGLELAHRFAQIFHEEAQKLDYSKPIHCGIGIAVDSIAGFYPESGTKEYDLYGRAVVLATRYEGMRKVILKEPASVIILQERVFESLDKHIRLEFIPFELRERSIVVRDDPAATWLYYKILNTQEAQQISTLKVMEFPLYKKS